MGRLKEEGMAGFWLGFKAKLVIGRSEGTGVSGTESSARGGKERGMSLGATWVGELLSSTRKLVGNIGG